MVARPLFVVFYYVAVGMPGRKHHSGTHIKSIIGVRILKQLKDSGLRGNNVLHEHTSTSTCSVDM